MNYPINIQNKYHTTFMQTFDFNLIAWFVMRVILKGSNDFYTLGNDKDWCVVIILLLKLACLMATSLFIC